VRACHACFISSTLHVYIVPLKQSPRRPLVQPDTHAITLLLYSNFACTITLSALLSSHAASRGGAEIRFSQGSRTCCIPVRHVRQLELAFAALKSHLFTFPLRSRPWPQIAFSLWLLATSSGAGTIARGNIHIASSLV
jgi:hypothetical protein